MRSAKYGDQNRARVQDSDCEERGRLARKNRGNGKAEGFAVGTPNAAWFLLLLA